MDAGSTVFYNALWRMAKAFNSGRNIPEALRACLTAANEAIGADGSAVWLKRPEDGKLRVAAAAGSMSGSFPGKTTASDEGIEGGVFTTGRPQTVSNFASDPEQAGRYTLGAVYRIRTLMCVPLDGEGGRLGCLELINKHDNAAFDEYDCELGESLASAIAFGLESGAAERPMQEPGTSVAVLQGVTCRALRSFGLELAAGGVTTVCGLGARAQEALVRLLMLEAKPESGSFTIGGAEPAYSSAALRAHKRDVAGLVSARLGLAPHLSARGNVALAAGVASDPMGVDEALAMAGLDADTGALGAEALDDMQRMCVCLARALVKKPKYIVAELDGTAADLPLLLLLKAAARKSGAAVLALSPERNEEALKAIHAASVRVCHAEAGALTAAMLAAAADGPVEVPAQAEERAEAPEAPQDTPAPAEAPEGAQPDVEGGADK